MAPVGGPHRRDARGMAGCSQPIVHGRANSAPFERRLALPFMAGNQEQNPIAARNRALQRPIDRFPGAIEAVAVQVERPVGLDLAGLQAPVPSAIEGRAVM